jgi:hypothetical protein
VSAEEKVMKRWLCKVLRSLLHRLEGLESDDDFRGRQLGMVRRGLGPMSGSRNDIEGAIVEVTPLGMDPVFTWKNARCLTVEWRCSSLGDVPTIRTQEEYVARYGHPSPWFENVHRPPSPFLVAKQGEFGALNLELGAAEGVVGTTPSGEAVRMVGAEKAGGTMPSDRLQELCGQMYPRADPDANEVLSVVGEYLDEQWRERGGK